MAEPPDIKKLLEEAGKKMLEREQFPALCLDDHRKQIEKWAPGLVKTLQEFQQFVPRFKVVLDRADGRNLSLLTNIAPNADETNPETAGPGGLRITVSRAHIKPMLVSFRKGHFHEDGFAVPQAHMTKKEVATFVANTLATLVKERRMDQALRPAQAPHGPPDLQP